MQVEQPGEQLMISFWLVKSHFERRMNLLKAAFNEKFLHLTELENKVSVLEKRIEAHSFVLSSVAAKVSIGNLRLIHRESESVEKSAKNISDLYTNNFYGNVSCRYRFFSDRRLYRTLHASERARATGSRWPYC